MTIKANVALIGGKHLMAETLLEILHERKFPLAKIEVFDEVEHEGDLIEFDKKSLSFKALSDFNADAFDIIFNFQTDFLARYQNLIRQTTYVIDLSEPDTPEAFETPGNYVVPEANADQLDAGNVFTCPNSAAIAASLILKKLELDISQVHLHVMQPVSAFGKAGVDEIAEQTTHLLSARPFENKVFNSQVAFNVLPTEAHEGEASTQETAIYKAVKQIIPGEYGLNVSVVTVPVFFGTSMTITIQSYDEVALHYVYDALADVDIFAVIEADNQEGLPSAVGDANGTDKIYISRLRISGIDQNMINMWCVIDNGRKGSTLNGVQMAEILVKSYL